MHVQGMRNEKILFILFFVPISFLTSCLEAEVEFDLKKNGSGEMRMKVLPLDSSLNLFIHEMENEVRKKQNVKDLEVTKRTEPDGRLSLFVREKFKRVEDTDENCKFVSYKDYDEFAMDIPSDFQGIVKKVKVNMPGQIIESNVKNFEGKSLVWHRTRPSDSKLVIKSKPSEPFVKAYLLAIILAVAIVAVTFLSILSKIQKRKVTLEEYIFCPECGTKADPGDNFCQNCGQGLK